MLIHLIVLSDWLILAQPPTHWLIHFICLCTGDTLKFILSLCVCKNVPFSKLLLNVHFFIIKCMSVLHFKWYVSKDIVDRHKTHSPSFGEGKNTFIISLKNGEKVLYLWSILFQVVDFFHHKDFHQQNWKI